MTVRVGAPRIIGNGSGNANAVNSAAALAALKGKDLFQLGGPAVLGHRLTAIVSIQRGRSGRPSTSAFDQKRPTPGFRGVEAEIQKLDGGVGYQIDQRASRSFASMVPTFALRFPSGSVCRHFSCGFRVLPG